MALGMKGKWAVPVIASILILGTLGLSSIPVYASFLTPVEIIDATGDGSNALDSPFHVATDSSGNVFVVGGDSDNVFKITPSGTITEIIDSTGDGSNALGTPLDVATDSSGNVFVTGSNTNNVFQISTPGSCKTSGGTPCTITEIIDAAGDGSNALDSPLDVATDSSGNVFVTGSGNVFQISTPGSCKTSGGTPCTITEIIDSAGDGSNALITPFGVATDSSGNVFVSGADTENVFQISTPGTCKTSGGTPCTITEIIDSTGDGSNALITPFNVATDSSGNVFVGGLSSNNVFQISTPGSCKTSGGTPCTITEIIDAAGDGGNTLKDPIGVATDSSGNVFVAGSSTTNAFQISTPGTCSTVGTPCTITEIIDSTGDGSGNTLGGINGVATDLPGNVFVTGLGTHNVFKIELEQGTGPPSTPGNGAGNSDPPTDPGPPADPPGEGDPPDNPGPPSTPGNGAGNSDPPADP